MCAVSSSDGFFSVMHAWGPQIDLRDTSFLAFANAKHRFLEPDYEDYDVASDINTDIAGTPSFASHERLGELCRFRLIFAGKQLRDDKTTKDYNIVGDIYGSFDPLGWKERLKERRAIKTPSTEASLIVNLCKDVRNLDDLFSLIIVLGKGGLVGEGKIHFSVAIDSFQVSVLQLAKELLIIKPRESLLNVVTEHVKANHEYEPTAPSPIPGCFSLTKAYFISRDGWLPLSSGKKMEKEMLKEKVPSKQTHNR
ncbi:hypothetical protein L6452_14369 [Arctium lappa]|uniref:Uncharacterized protein n=1 Tax=Arctium lappa TaxID=4217 RepID=A0ACB9CKT0_ARCLA|nr:hypothetical protein L6452_14369 [Arctium lappa]